MADQRPILRAAPYGVELELFERGDGPVVVVLHDTTGADPRRAFIDRLAQRHRVIVPSHPGFGHSTAPSELDSVDDLAYFYLELFDELALDSYSLVGTAFGGWVAAEIAIHAPAALQRLALIDAFGIRVGGREDRDIVDVFAISREELARRLFHDPDIARAEFDLSQRSDAEVEVIARNREATARYGWLPYLHNPRLRRRLHRISVATLVLWGAHDGILDTDYGRAYADAIPGAQFELIDGAGHLPHLERPDAVADILLDFLGSEQLVIPTTRSAQ